MRYALALILTLLAADFAEARVFGRRRARTYSYSATYSYSYGSAYSSPQAAASAKAAQQARDGACYHCGGGYGGGYAEGVGCGSSAAAALNSCCFTGQRRVAGSAVFQGRNGMFYACKIFW